ncbi:Imm45 family immunity protein [Acinetobacter sp. ESL0695]|uniref:Imm45 family immunity protein n=1 Tax=Acinetobacter sp. ESL0695 TaxID=2983215 RepID=UPI0023F12081|nr:Imm45 family immunity protein [Acinetobacter sp. ESL0695]WEV49310.1 Imm45 family immunity protein [Acinetobacter sp. ESL0695]
MNWSKLVDNPNIRIQRGMLFKFEKKYPFKEEVIMMTCEEGFNPFGLGLISLTGAQAGDNMYTLFPNEATRNGLMSKSLIENWNEWVYPNCNINEVMIHEGLSAHEL